MTLAGQVALITGAGSGIGAAVTRCLAREGVHLVLNGRTASKLDALTTVLAADDPDIQILTVPGDVRQAETAHEIVRQAVARFNRVDILVNNAGVAGGIGLLQEIPADEVHRILDTNLKGAIFMMQEVLRQSMVGRRAGTILNINSIAGKTAFPYWSLYDASKFGLRAITEAVAEEQRVNNIKVVGIYPGAVDTPIWNGISLDHAPDKAGMLDPDTLAQTVVHILKQPEKTFIPDITLTPLHPAV